MAVFFSKNHRPVSSSYVAQPHRPPWCHWPWRFQSRNLSPLPSPGERCNDLDDMKTTRFRTMLQMFSCTLFGRFVGGFPEMNVKWLFWMCLWEKIIKQTRKHNEEIVTNLIDVGMFLGLGNLEGLLEGKRRVAESNTIILQERIISNHRRLHRIVPSSELLVASTLLKCTLEGLSCRKSAERIEPSGSMFRDVLETSWHPFDYEWRHLTLDDSMWIQAAPEVFSWLVSAQHPEALHASCRHRQSNSPAMGFFHQKQPKGWTFVMMNGSWLFFCFWFGCFFQLLWLAKVWYPKPLRLQVLLICRKGSDQRDLLTSWLPQKDIKKAPWLHAQGTCWMIISIFEEWIVRKLTSSELFRAWFLQRQQILVVLQQDHGAPSSFPGLSEEYHGLR